MNGMCTTYYNYCIDILNQTLQAPLIKSEAGMCAI